MRITNVRHDNKGTIIEYRTDTNQVLSQIQAVEMAENGQLEGVEVRPSKNGSKYLRSIADAQLNNNLDNLPEF